MSRKETYDDVSYIAIIPISYAAGTHSLDYTQQCNSRNSVMRMLLT